MIYFTETVNPPSRSSHGLAKEEEEENAMTDVAKESKKRLDNTTKIETAINNTVIRKKELRSDDLTMA